MRLWRDADAGMPKASPLEESRAAPAFLESNPDPSTRRVASRASDSSRPREASWRRSASAAESAESREADASATRPPDAARAARRAATCWPKPALSLAQAFASEASFRRPDSAAARRLRSARSSAASSCPGGGGAPPAHEPRSDPWAFRRLWLRQGTRISGEKGGG